MLLLGLRGGSGDAPAGLTPRASLGTMATEDNTNMSTAPLRQFAGMPAIAQREFTGKEAAREQVYLKVSLDGPSGSGKTLSALLLALGLVESMAPPELRGDAKTTERQAWAWTKIAVVDTENGSAKLYAGTVVATPDGDVTIGAFRHYAFDPPYDARYYIALCETLGKEDMLCVIFDSITPEWNGPGGILDTQARIGGQAQHWKIVSPVHQAFLDAMRLAPYHLIATMRSKTETVLEKDAATGKMKVEKRGLKAEQREGAEYEFSVVISVDHTTHQASAVKDRTRLFGGLAGFVITPDHGRWLGEWAQAGTCAVGSAQWVDRACGDIRDCATMDSVRLVVGRVKRAGNTLTPTQRAALNKAVTETQARLEKTAR